jgi:hypothetical protein
MAIIKSGATTDQWTIDPTSKAGRVTLYDPAGNVIESVYDPVTNAYYQGVAIRQDVHVSAANSSTANIGAGNTFTGVGETTLGVAAIQVNLFINQTATVFVDQSADNANWDITDSWQVPANTGESRTIQATDNYYRVRVTNIGSGTATVVRLNTAVCPVCEAVPRSLSTGGNLKTTVSAEWQDTATVTGLYAASSFRTAGTAASPMNMFALLNPSANTKNVVVRELNIMSDSTAALTTVAQQAISSKPAVLPTGGTSITPVKYRTSYASASATVLGATASDGGAATPITATAGTSIWQQYLDRLQTLAGWVGHPIYRMIPEVGTDLRQFILAPGESMLVQLVTAVPATTMLICNVAWTEYQSL